MRKGTRSYITLELRGNDLEIAQRYTIGDNHVGNDKIMEVVYEWHKDIINMHEKDAKTYMQISEDFNNKLFDENKLKVKQQLEGLRNQLIQHTQLDNGLDY